jgi:hypothetical protein
VQVCRDSVSPTTKAWLAWCGCAAYTAISNSFDLCGISLALPAKPAVGLMPMGRKSRSGAAAHCRSRGTGARRLSPRLHRRPALRTKAILTILPLFPILFVQKGPGSVFDIAMQRLPKFNL